MTQSKYWSSEAEYVLEVPERDLEFRIALGGPKTPVGVVGPPNSYKSLLGQALAVLISGETPAGTKQGGFRGIFPMLTWIGEGASASVTDGENRRECYFHPIDPEDGKPQVFTFSSEMEFVKPFVYLSGACDFVLTSGMSIHFLAHASHEASLISQHYRSLFPGSRISTELVRASLPFTNTVTPSGMLSILAVANAVTAAMRAGTLILDLQNPFLESAKLVELHKVILKLARLHENKVISFGPEWLHREAGYDKIESV